MNIFLNLSGRHGKKKTKCRLFGNILKAPRSDPLVQIVLEFDGVTSKIPLFRRPGRPRADWIIEIYKDSCFFLFGPHTVFDISDYQFLYNIKQVAINRIGPFATHVWWMHGIVPSPKGFRASHGIALGALDYCAVWCVMYLHIRLVPIFLYFWWNIIFYPFLS